MRKYSSVISSIDKSKLQEIVSGCDSLSEILKHFGLVVSGASYKLLKRTLVRIGIDFSHIKLGLGCNKGRVFLKTTAVPLETVMIEKSTYSRGNLKKRLLKTGLLKNECSVCGHGEMWNGKRMVLVLDHINGINDDHRMENLRIVCPNCNSQLDTTNGKNRRKKKHCITCGILINKRTSEFCDSCRPTSTRKVEERPTKEELEIMVKEMPMTHIGRKYGVSDNTIRKWCVGCGMVLERKRFPVEKRYCSCGELLSTEASGDKCKKCFRISSRKVVWPDANVLREEVREFSLRHVAMKYGVTRGAVNGWCKNYGIVV